MAKTNKTFITKRLLDIASLVDRVETLADIGTDHGYLPIYLIKNNIASFALACDVAIMPLESAKQNIKKYGLEDKIKLILCDGLSNVNKVDCVIISGMGGHLIIDILKNRNIDYNTYILQANNNVDILRRYLSENGFKIIDEKISYDHKKFYEIIKVTHGQQALNEQEITYGPINLINKSTFFIAKWKEILQRYQNIVTDFTGSKEELEKLNKKISEIELIIS